jgi:hypothetical protein
LLKTILQNKILRWNLEKDSKKKQTITVTLRIDKEIMDKLNDEVDSDGTSLNSLTNQVLKRYVEWNKFEDKSAMIPVASSVLKELFDGLDKDKVIKLAKDKAKDTIYNIILFMNGKVDFDILISWYKQRMKHCSEISDKKDEDKGNRIIIFKHELGENWSLYHKTILESICHDILSIPIKVDITSSTVKLDIK